MAASAIAWKRILKFFEEADNSLELCLLTLNGRRRRLIKIWRHFIGTKYLLGVLGITTTRRRPLPRHRQSVCASADNPRPQLSILSEILSRFSFTVCGSARSVTVTTFSPYPTTPTVPIIIACEFPNCQRTFTLSCHYNRHKKSHIHPVKCDICGRGFETPKDVKRHHNDVHDTTKIFFCHVKDCKYACSEGREVKGFPRKENWKRHLRNRHGLSDS
ncbi:hypothetical protein BKA61DRAFT_136866 [Leptodontidium sp. MPI-SDFR-AT-0119]|nr:hypothetical protein BKA61DRAFT_136866 [Leptodontidium sp. MPI-SDFR-AT-0119]